MKGMKVSFSSGHLPRSEALLEPHTAAIFECYYRVSERGNFEGKNIRNVTRPPVAVAVAHDLTEVRAAGIAKRKQAQTV